MSVGSLLIEERTRAGLTVEELATRTRIPRSIIQDLEKNNFDSSGGAAYARGHIRTIARICSFDATPILNQFESQTIPLSKTIRELLNESNVTKVKSERKQLSWRGLSGILAGVALFGLVGSAILSIDSSQLRPEQSNQAVNESGEESSQSDRSEISTDGAAATASRDVKVTLRAVNGLSWVAVNDSSGITQFSGRIRQGEERSFTDNQLLYLVIGNAGAIELTVNGENLGLSGRVGEVVRLEFGPQAISQRG